MARKGRGRRAALAVLALVLVAIVAAGAVLYHAVWSSVGRIQTYAQIASSAGNSLSDDISDLNLTALDADAQTVSDQARAISRELDGWQWEVASRIPPIAGEVELGRTLSQVCLDLSDQALLPVTELVRQARGQLASGSISEVVDGADTLQDLADAVERARSVVAGCRIRLDQAPQSGIDGLKQAHATVEDVLDQADDALDQVQPAVDIIEIEGEVSDDIADALSDLLDAGSSSDDQAASDAAGDSAGA